MIHDSGIPSVTTSLLSLSWYCALTAFFVCWCVDLFQLRQGERSGKRKETIPPVPTGPRGAGGRVSDLLAASSGSLEPSAFAAAEAMTTAAKIPAAANKAALMAARHLLR
jgi:hypothetical protein